MYTNRELSWLEFNERVLEEARDKENPLMERMNFLAISASNLDEFFMIRVSSIMRSASTSPDASGLTPAEQLAAISKRAHEMIARQYSSFTRSLLPAMENNGVFFLTYDKLSRAQKKYVDAYFNDVLYQVLTPMAIDQARPFPNINNLKVYIFLELATPGNNAPLLRASAWDAQEQRWRIADGRIPGAKYAVMQIPTIVPRIVQLPSNDGHHFILLEDIILAHSHRLFVGHKVARTAFLRVTRNSDLVIDYDDAGDLMDEVTRSIKGRRQGEPVRVEITKGLSAPAMTLLEKSLRITPDKIYNINGPLDLAIWRKFAHREEFASMRYTPIAPRPVVAFANEEKSMFDIIREKDVLVNHPYMSFDCVVRFVEEAAEDPGVLAIKQTLYRVSGESSIVNALIKAAENGKQVSVLVELKARFDEENNINWAKLLEQSGAHVVYGLPGLKTHCKACLVVRKEGDVIRRYMHLGTGNYNEKTATIYTDYGLFTCCETFGDDISNLFNLLTGYSQVDNWHKFAVAPTSLRDSFMRLIETERANARAKKPAAITARMNSLSDVGMIQELYKASQDGVKIRLLVRGICCLKPGVAGISDNITVSSIVDRYLEHSRVYIFENDGNPKVYLASADLMRRNLDRRVEIMFPIEDDELKTVLIELTNLALSDNIKRREAGADGIYRKPSRRGHGAVHSQLEIHNRV